MTLPSSLSHLQTTETLLVRSLNTYRDQIVTTKVSFANAVMKPVSILPESGRSKPIDMFSFASLSPLERVSWLAKNKFGDFALLVASCAMGLYFIVNFASLLLRESFNLIFPGAAADENSLKALPPAVYDVVGIVLLAFVGIALLGGIFVWATSKDNKKSNQGFEIVKSLGVGALGYFAGRKS